MLCQKCERNWISGRHNNPETDEGDTFTVHEGGRDFLVCRACHERARSAYRGHQFRGEKQR
jgi:hypothetical protein